MILRNFDNNNNNNNNSHNDTVSHPRRPKSSSEIYKFINAKFLVRSEKLNVGQTAENETVTVETAVSVPWATPQQDYQNSVTSTTVPTELDNQKPVQNESRMYELWT